MIRKVPVATITGPMARPSKPSVKLTALLVPTMTKYTQGIYNKPKEILTLFKNKCK